ncbi:hypothetical protein HYDPIDRAFT_111424 [Hydnomerulius pinastri MD-312]|uniref:Uncharacterized protein n=1 Tax=Hydnomerulius pinastri MD-312 TaxID=994086 RepID=A0A0C9WA83_9AGAM|nr:hypothetical protein HYDPIDRAFT_111424 [Hydnomerulius pinastri MD-312]
MESKRVFEVRVCPDFVCQTHSEIPQNCVIVEETICMLGLIFAGGLGTAAALTQPLNLL